MIQVRRLKFTCAREMVRIYILKDFFFYLSFVSRNPLVFITFHLVENAVFVRRWNTDELKSSKLCALKHTSVQENPFLRYNTLTAIVWHLFLQKTIFTSNDSIQWSILCLFWGLIVCIWYSRCWQIERLHVWFSPTKILNSVFFLSKTNYFEVAFSLGSELCFAVHFIFYIVLNK